jgi:threonine/homoserine/homoserine lactone efflux protein
MDLFTFLLAVLLLELTPGPNMAYLATLALSRGRTAGLIATAGVVFGLAVPAMVAGWNGRAHPTISTTLRCGALDRSFGYLLYLAWEGWRTEKETSPERADLAVMAGPLFLRGFLSNVFQSKIRSILCIGASTFVGTKPGAPSLPTQMAVFGILYVGVATAVHGIIVALAAQLRPWLVEGPRQQTVRRILSVVLALVAIWLAWTARR